MRPTLIALFFSIAVTGGGCSSSSSSPQCTGELADVGQGCPASFDGTEANLPDCGSTLGTLGMAWSCGDLIMLSTAPNYSGLSCFYDTKTHQLVGAEEAGDVAIFCGNSPTRQAGRVSATCGENAPTVTRTCADGGSAD